MYQLNDKIGKVKPYKAVESRFKIHLDANESFLPLPKDIKAEMTKAWSAAELNRYPDSDAKEVCKAFADFYNLSPENVVAGNGSDELIAVIMTAFLEKGDAFATIIPDFSMYSFYGQLCECRNVQISKDENYQIDVDTVINTCNNEDVKLLIFSNPCNPTSVGLSAEKVRRIIKKVNALVILDEAYMDFWNESLLDEVESYDNLIILRTCSKAFGMAGIRLGFAVSQKRLRYVLMAVKSPYNVNVLSQKTGTVLLRRKEEIQAAVSKLIDSKNALETAMRKLAEKSGKFHLVDGRTNFITMTMKNPEKFYNFLAENRIAVRFTEGMIRVTCGAKEENESFIEASERFFTKEV